MNKSLARQYYDISPSADVLSELADNKCDATFTKQGCYTVWIFDDDSILRIDFNGNITVDGVPK